MGEPSKGPWTAHRVGVDDQAEWFISNAANSTIADEIENEADADLIAAAPDMLEALKEIVARIGTVWLDDVEEGHPAQQAIKKASAAIAKAEGRNA